MPSPRFSPPGPPCLLFAGATVFFVLAHAATIVAAFLIAYYTHGFWVKESTYREQVALPCPRVHPSPARGGQG